MTNLPTTKSDYFRLAIVILAILTFRFFLCNPEKQHESEPTPDKVTSEILAEKFHQLQSGYIQQKESLQHTSDSLKAVIEKDLSTLEEIRKQAQVERTGLKKRLAVVHTDTLLMIRDCDSLREETRQYIAQTELADSLCQETIEELHLLNQTKDIALEVCNDRIARNDTLITQSLSAQHALEDQVKRQAKSLRKKQRREKWLTGAGLVLGGITAILLFK